MRIKNVSLKNRIKSIVIKSPFLFDVAKLVSLRNTRIKQKIGQISTYNDWIKRREPDLWKKQVKGVRNPLISVVVPTFNTPDKYLIPMIKSMMNQTYKNWELCISDASTNKLRKHAIHEIAKTDSRIKYTHNKGLHISDNTNKAIDIADGEYIGLLDHDDILSVHALNEVASAIINNSQADLIYSDEDKLSDDGKLRSLPFFKPDWSPELLLGVNYITHFLVFNKKLLKKADKLRSDFDGAQDYDLILRLTEVTENIIHIPNVLYHWRLADGSTAKSVDEKGYADTAGQRALREAVQRRNIKADVIEIKERPTNYRLKYKLPKKQPKVSIIIPFKDKQQLLKTCVESILEKTTYKNYEIILLSNNSSESKTHEYLKSLGKNKRCNVYYWDHPFNYSAINNFGVNKSSGEYIVLLNNDTEVITPDWLSELIGVASQPNIGAVGPMLLYPDPNDGIQHAGVVLGMKGMAGHVFRHRKPGEWTDFGLPSWPRNYLAVTGACLAVEKAKYLDIGGLDERFTISGNDVAFCLKLYEAGYRNVYWPFSELYHHESVSVKTYEGNKKDYDLSLKYYRKYIQRGDPYYNENLDIMVEGVAMRKKL